MPPNNTAPRSSSAFTRQQRLLKGAQFNHVFAAPRRSSDRYFTVLMRHNDHGEARLGLAIAKKRIRLAVARNRIKRLIRESFRHNAAQLGGVDIVVLSRFNMNGFDKKMDNAALLRSLAQHWQRLSAL